MAQRYATLQRGNDFMVILLQLMILIGVLVWRGFRLFGKHLSPIAGMAGCLQYINRDKNGRIEARHIGIEREGGVPFIVRRERWYHRYFKKLGMAHEIAMPDDKFNQRYFITTDFPNHLEKLMHAGPLQQRLGEMMRMGVEAFHIMPHRMWCVLEGDIDKPDIHFEPLFTKMREIDAEAQAPETGAVAVRARIKMTWALLFLAAHAGVLACGVLGVIPIAWLENSDIVDNGRLLVFGALVGCGVLVVWGGLILAMFKGTSWFCWVMADFWLWGMMGFVLCGMLVVRDVNVTAPQPPAELKQQTVLVKDCHLRCRKSCGRRCTRHENYSYINEDCRPDIRAKEMARRVAESDICQSSAWFEYELLAQSWRKSAAPEGYQVHVKEPVFDAVRRGGFVTIPVYEGALGMEWVDVDAVRP